MAKVSWRITRCLDFFFKENISLARQLSLSYRATTFPTKKKRLFDKARIF